MDVVPWCLSMRGDDSLWYVFINEFLSFSFKPVPVNFYRVVKCTQEYIGKLVKFVIEGVEVGSVIVQDGFAFS